MDSRHIFLLKRPDMAHPLRLSSTFMAACMAAAAVLGQCHRAQAEVCQLGATCSFDVTTSVDIPGFGTATNAMPVTVDLTDLKADGSGKVGVDTPEVSSTTDTRSKKTKFSNKGNGKKSTMKVKQDKGVKETKVKISKSKTRRGS